MIIRVIILWLFSFGLVFGQDSLNINSRSFSLDQFYEVVLGHPDMRLAEIAREQGALKLAGARGNFDPTFKSDFRTKEFVGSDYFDVWNTELTIPTPLSLDLKAGYERNQGIFLNPQNNVPGDGLYALGVSLPLGRGLLNNPRNLALKQARIENRQGEVEAQDQRNNLFLKAAQVYWKWYENHEKSRLIREALEVAQQRLEAVKMAVEQGDRAAIDSVEAEIQVQNWQNLRDQQSVALENTHLVLENYTWGTRLDWSTLHPVWQDKPDLLSLEHYHQYALSSNPQWQLLQLESEIVAIEVVQAKEQLKPILNLNYQLLLESTSGLSETGFYQNNYKGGIEFSMPLLLRKERAKLKGKRLKAEGIQLKQSQSIRRLLNDVEVAHNQILMWQQLWIQQAQVVNNYQRLLDGERLKFFNGESSLFLINDRESKTLAAQLKQIEILVAMELAFVQLHWVSGLLPVDQQTL